MGWLDDLRLKETADTFRCEEGPATASQSLLSISKIHLSLSIFAGCMLVRHH